MLTLIQLSIYYAKFRIEEILVILFGGLIFLLSREKKISKNLIFIIGIFLLISIFKIALNNYEYNKFFEQLLIVVGVVISYYYIFQKFSYKQIFEKYLKVTNFFCCIGLIQFIVYFMLKIDVVNILDIFYSYRTNVTINSNFIRINPFSFESGNFAQTLIPAFIYHVDEFIRLKKFNFSLILVVLNMILTFSISGWICIPIYIIYLIIKFKKIFHTVFICILLLFLNNIFINLFEKRMLGIINGIKNFNLEYIETLHPSSYAILSNLYIALNNKNLIFGTGLGTHPQSYMLLYPNKLYYLFGLNMDEGYSLLVRILSEFGLIGIFVFIYFLLKNFNKDSNLNVACGIGIISFFIRGGLYTRFGLIMFMYLYYLSNKYPDKKGEVREKG